MSQFARDIKSVSIVIDGYLPTCTNGKKNMYSN